MLHPHATWIEGTVDRHKGDVAIRMDCSQEGHHGPDLQDSMMKEG
jgi:hypothetical protein